MNTEEQKRFLASEWLESWNESGVEWLPTTLSRRLSAQRVLDVSARAPDLPVHAAALSDAFLTETVPGTAQTEVPASQDSPLPTFKVVFVLDKPLQDPAFTLLQRMTGAMNLAPTDVGIADDENPALARAFAADSTATAYAAPQAFIALGEIAGSRAVSFDVQTHSLDAVLQNPALKRPVWEALQKIMQKLSS